MIYICGIKLNKKCNNRVYFVLKKNCIKIECRKGFLFLVNLCIDWNIIKIKMIMG